jgi:hypothetical protein
MARMRLMVVSAGDDTKAKLKIIAESLGFIDQQHGGGSVSAMLRAMADAGVCIHHIDGNPDNNEPTNLRLVVARENVGAAQ